MPGGRDAVRPSRSHPPCSRGWDGLVELRPTALAEIGPRCPICPEEIPRINRPCPAFQAPPGKYIQDSSGTLCLATACCGGSRKTLLSCTGKTILINLISEKRHARHRNDEFQALLRLLLIRFRGCPPESQGDRNRQPGCQRQPAHHLSARFRICRRRFRPGQGRGRHSRRSLYLAVRVGIRGYCPVELGLRAFPDVLAA